MIESALAAIPIWWSGSDWTTDCHIGKQFDTEHDADLYIRTVISYMIEDVKVTEHMFMSPISTVENLN